MALRFEFDAVNKILRFHIEGPLTDELLAMANDELGRYWTATDARACIADLSQVTENRQSGNFVRDLARREPPMPTRPGFIVVGESTVGYGLARMFQIVRERPLLQVVNTMEEALAELCVQSPQFEPLSPD